jgi:hypothetical protein
LPIRGPRTGAGPLNPRGGRWDAGILVRARFCSSASSSHAPVAPDEDALILGWSGRRPMR